MKKVVLLVLVSTLAVIFTGCGGSKEAEIPSPEDVSTEKVEEFVACLLYTSPSPRDRTRSRMPSSA